MADWKDRLGKFINFESPEGNEFQCYWIGNPRTVEKKVGVFEFPGVKGTSTQDLGVKGFRHSIKFFFEGVSNDLEAERFMKATSETGEWIVEHPTKGKLSLQPISFTEKIKPVEEGNLTGFDSQWIEPRPKTARKSVAELGADVDAQSAVVNDSATAQYAENVKQETAAETFALETTTAKDKLTVKETLKNTLEKAKDVKSKYDNIDRAIDITTARTPIELGVLSSQIQNLVEVTGLSGLGVADGLVDYTKLTNNISIFGSEF